MATPARPEELSEIRSADYRRGPQTHGAVLFRREIPLERLTGICVLFLTLSAEDEIRTTLGTALLKYLVVLRLDSCLL